MPLSLNFVQPGNYTIDDNGVPGDNTSVIRDGNGVVIFILTHPADALTFTVASPGVNLNIDFTDTLGAAHFTIGNLTDAVQSPDSIVMDRVSTTATVTLVSNGAISEGGADAGSDIVAGALIMSAATGIGTPGNAIETQLDFASVLEAETNTGGINISNFGSVQIGTLNDEVNGLHVLTSGDITLTTLGSIFLGDVDLDPANPPLAPSASVSGGSVSGNVTLTASGFDSDIIADADTDAITAEAGNITLTASRDIAFGTFSADFDNDVRASGGVTINAGRDFLLDGFSDLASDDFGDSTGGNVVINAGRNIHLRNVAGIDATIVASGSAGADVILTAGGALVLDAPTPNAVSSSSGNVIVNADRMLIGASSGITANNGQVVLRSATAGREINVGGGADGAFALTLSDAELNRIFTPTLTIGSVTAGSLSFIAAISPLNVTNLTLQSGEDVTISNAVTTSGSLTARAGDDLFLLGSISASVFNGFVDQDGAADAAGGVGMLNGIVSAVATLTGNVNADTLTGNAGINVLNGAGAADTMRGIGGNDVYVVDNVGDIVDESIAGSSGSDIVQSSITFALNNAVAVLGAVENLLLLGSANIHASGNILNNLLIGNSGNNTLNGSTGTDVMRGMAGGDTYVVDNAGDIVDESIAGSAGNDTVRSAITFGLNNAATVKGSVENLLLLGAANINASGNTLNNLLTGNSGNNTLNGSTGTDVMRGMAGGDSYVVDNAGDIVDESIAGSAGNDTVQSAISFSLANAATVKGSVENLLLLGAANINASGNGGNNLLTGNSGNNLLNGGTGTDVMRGMGGSDSFFFNTALGPTNVDIIDDFSVPADTITLENAIFTALGAGALAATAFHIGAAAADALDRIIYNNVTGALIYDTNGSAAGGATQFATLDTGLAMTNADFFIV